MVLDAPVKGFYTFMVAHTPIIEEPELALRILQEDVRIGTTSLADSP